MVLASLGLEIEEAPLRALCDCTVFGTEALKAVDAVRRLGFAGTTKQTLSMEDLRQQLQGGSFPIVLVNLTYTNKCYRLVEVFQGGTAYAEKYERDIRGAF